MLTEIKNALIKHDFAVVSQTRITDKDLKYHVEATHAEVDQLFIHYRPLAAYFKINHTCHDCWKEERTNTEITSFFHYISLKELARLSFDEKIYLNDKTWYDNFSSPNAPWIKKIIPGYNTNFVVDPAIRVNGYGSHNGESTYEISQTFMTSDYKKNITADDAVKLILSLVEQVKPYLSVKFAHNSQLSYLTGEPEYQFKGCYEFFQKQFDWQYFRLLFEPKPPRRFK